jgi:hypothetical protein
MIAAIGLALMVLGGLPLRAFAAWYTSYWWELPAVLIVLIGFLMLIASVCMKLVQVMP